MGAETEIAWADSTFNPWWGCQRVSPGCENCYAESFDRRLGRADWGPRAPRRFFGDKHWAEPMKWDRTAAAAGRRHRVFCASMADVFEDRTDLIADRIRLWKLIRATPNLDWLLLTKRPENLLRMLPWTTDQAHETCEMELCKAAILDGIACPPDGCDIIDRVRAFEPWPNVWIGTTVEDQKRADERIPRLRAIPAVVRFLSMEPLLEFPRIDLAGIDWVIVGGESGPRARPFDIGWAHAVVDQCRAAGVAPFVKQLGDNCTAGAKGRIPGLAPKGGDIDEFPGGLRVREFPAPRNRPRLAGLTESD